MATKKSGGKPQTIKKPVAKSPDGAPDCFGKYPADKVPKKCRTCRLHVECKIK
jgi:hypothetical protein